MLGGSPAEPRCTNVFIDKQAKAKIMVVRDIERDDIEYISKTLNCLPIAHADHMKPEKLGHADRVDEIQVSTAPFGVQLRHRSTTTVANTCFGDNTGLTTLAGPRCMDFCLHCSKCGQVSCHD